MDSTAQVEPASFAGMIDLAAERVGGKVLFANDEFFAPKENLIQPGRGVFIPDRYTEVGKWMDGWETRRRRTPGHDFCIVRLGLPGVIRGVDVDTNHFLGNHPWYASLEACAAESDASDHLTGADVAWAELLPKSPLAPGSQNLFAVADPLRWTHARLNIHPDGGVARLRIYGQVAPDWSRIGADEMIDLAAVQNGGVVVAASDMFFGSKENLIMPGRSESMRDGWETRRRRGPGHDWAIVRLGAPGKIERLEIDTSHFKGNYPDQCSVEACFLPARPVDALTWSEVEWKELLPQVKLEAHRVHEFKKELRDTDRCTHLKLNIYPDGGVSRLRAYGVPELPAG